jgi:hypothetical protein
MGCQCSKDSNDSPNAPAVSAVAEAADIKVETKSPSQAVEAVAASAQPVQQTMNPVSQELLKEEAVVQNSPVVEIPAPVDNSDSVPQKAEAAKEAVPVTLRGKSATAMWEDAVEDTRGISQGDAYYSADSEEVRMAEAKNAAAARAKKQNSRPKKKKAGRN